MISALLLRLVDSFWRHFDWRVYFVYDPAFGVIQVVPRRKFLQSSEALRMSVPRAVLEKGGYKIVVDYSYTDALLNTRR